MKDIMIFGITLSAPIWASAVMFVTVIILLMVKKAFFTRISRFAEKSKSKIDDIFIEALNFPLTVLIIVFGATVVTWISPVEYDARLTRYFFLGIRVMTIIAVIYFLDRLLKNILNVYGHKMEFLKASTGVVHGIVRILVFGLGLLIMLDSFGISITPVLASLGVGSLAVALALQPTLENFFSGIQLVIDKPIQKGQFIKLDSGEEGYVHKIGWRSTWVKMLPNNVVVLPNKVIVNSKVLNYYYPDKEMAVLVQVGVHYDSDLKRVERVTMEAGEEIMKTVQGGCPDFKPFIRYHTFNDFSIDFTVILRCKEFVDNYLIKHEFIKKLHERYRKEGIVIPFPINALNYTQEKAEVRK